MTWLALCRLVLDLSWLMVLFMILRHFWCDRQILLQAQSWLKVKGHVTECEWIKSGHSIWPKIQYSYQVYEQNMIGEYLFLDTTHNNPHSKYARQIAYKAAVAYTEEREIDVYYNPNHPQQSALDVTMPKKLTIILTLLWMLIILHLGLIVWRFLGH